MYIARLQAKDFKLYKPSRKKFIRHQCKIFKGNFILCSLWNQRDRKKEDIQQTRYFYFIWKLNLTIWHLTELIIYTHIFYGFCCLFIGASQLWCDTLWKCFLPIVGFGTASSKGKQRRAHFKHKAWCPRNQEISSEAGWSYLSAFWYISVIYFLFMETG